MTLLCATLVADKVGAGLVLVEDFTGVDAGDTTKAALQYNGNTLSFDGHMLSSQLDGAVGSQLAYAGDRAIVAGLGVGQPAANGPSVGFVRSINNGDAALGAPDESVALSLAAADGLSTLYIANGFSGVASVVTIGGFAMDPQAASPNGTVAYSSGTVTWTVTSQGALTLGGLTGNQISTLNFAAPGASLGATLIFGNGTDPSEANEYGLRAFETVTVPEPSSLVLVFLSALCFRSRGRMA
ncbi:MAG TPA: hypothetical protein VF175_03720 [Lacipirellula sp.]